VKIFSIDVFHLLDDEILVECLVIVGCQAVVAAGVVVAGGLVMMVASRFSFDVFTYCITPCYMLFFDCS
jgi:hypothetical protein